MFAEQSRLQPAVEPSGFCTRKPWPSWLSTIGSPRPAWIVLQTKNFWCGPEKIGPSFGQFLSFSSPSFVLLVRGVTVITLIPLRRRSTTPTRAPSSSWKRFVTSIPLRFTRNELSGSSEFCFVVTLMSASPPLTCILSLESTSIFTDFAYAGEAARARSAAASSAAGSVRRIGTPPQAVDGPDAITGWT